MSEWGAQVAIDRHLDEIDAAEQSDSETCCACRKRAYRSDCVLTTDGWLCLCCDDYQHGLLEDVS